jgi:hypothetical protein
LSDQPDQPDQSGQETPGPHVLVLRAVFVPDGEDPPPEFAGDFRPLRIPATIDTETGEITSDSGINFGGAVRAEWHPGAGEDASGEDNQPQDPNKSG